MMQLLEKVRRIFDTNRPPMARFGADVDVYGGFETRTDPTEYYWNGQKRGGDRRHPYIIFQYTLDGWGSYREGKNWREGKAVQRCTPGTAFSALVPSDHVYCLPRESRTWTFLWVGLHHPYIVNRMARRMRECGRVLAIAPDSVLAARLLTLFEGVCRGTFRDAFALEQAQFDFLIEYDRLAHQRVYAPPQRESLLDQASAFVLKRLRTPVSVEQLAQTRGMSRSHFTHYFKAATGIAPARFVTQVRLREAAQRLVQSREKLETIARECGFADANHFCKVFRRHYHVSPGNFRKQLS